MFVNLDNIGFRIGQPNVWANFRIQKVQVDKQSTIQIFRHSDSIHSKKKTVLRHAWPCTKQEDPILIQMLPKKIKSVFVASYVILGNVMTRNNVFRN